MKWRDYMEEWRTIPDFPNYEITETGKIRHKEKKKTRKASPSKRGYPVISLRKDGKHYLRTIHILVAKTFIPNPENKPEINHKDGNKWNYNINNLEWTTRKENADHARRTGLHKSDGQKRVAQFDRNGMILNVFDSVTNASKETGIGRCNISAVARGNTRAKTAGGYYWRYI
jgi:hypothetical protein